MVFLSPGTHVVIFLRFNRHSIDDFARTTHPFAHYLFYVIEQLARLALDAYGIFAGIQLWKTRPAALMHAKRFLLLVVLFHLADFVTVVNIEWILGPPGTLGKYLPPAVLRQTRNLVYPVVWYAYLVNSERVRSTFPLGDATPNSQPAPL